MIERLTLRKGSTIRTVVLDRCVTRVVEAGQKAQRTSWLTGVMARARRDALVATMLADGWAVERRTTRRSRRTALACDEVRVIGREGTPFVADPGRKWPAGYAAFVERFGAGELEELRILAPAEVAARTTAWQELAPHAARLFENLREYFPAGDEAQVIVVAASLNGDVLGFPQLRPEELLLFPRGSNRFIGFGRTFEEALGAWCYDEDIAPRRVSGRRPKFRPG